jgi:predicted permease
MDSWWQDVRHSLRSLAKQPGFAVVAVVSLALGIGVNTAIFSTMNTLLLRPPAVRDLDQTVIVYHATPGNADRGTSFAAYERYRERRDTFARVMAFTGARPLSLIDGDRREQVYAQPVTAGFFAVADCDLLIGRPFDRDADRIVNPPLATVVSHAFWKRRFASDPAIVGTAVNLNGRPFTISGVAAPEFTGLDPEIAPDLWIPMTSWAHLVGQPARLTSDEHWITTVATLNAGVSLEQAQAAMAVAGQAGQPPAGQQTKVRSVRERSPGSATEILALGAIAFAMGLLVLGLACTNVANLLIARAATRQHEMSVRMALGGSRVRLVRLWLTESVMLSVSGGLIGLLFASWLLDLVVAFKPPTLIGQAEAPTLSIDFQLDVRIVAFTLVLSAVTAMVVGLISASQAVRPGAIRAATAGRVTDRRFAPGLNVRSTVIALQMALSMILLIPCGLFVRSWMNASAIDPGFSADRVLLLPISSDQAGVRVEKPPGFESQLAARVAALPGVDAATVMDPVPLWFNGNFAHFSIERGSAAAETYRIGFSRVAPRYFETLRIPLLRGRDFTPADNAAAPAVAIVNETMARRLWPDGDALGQRLRRRDGVREIVGIAKDAKYQNLADASPLWVYLPLAQEPTDNVALSLAVRTAGDPMALRSGIEREVKALIPAWPAFQFRTLDEGLALQRLLPRLGATLLGVLGAFGLLLAAVGVYGVMAYVVTHRTHEIGIRLALGAPTRSVLALVMRQGMTVCLIGAAIGTAMALAATRLLASLLYAVSASDPLTYIAVPLLLLAVALLACYLPARHVTRISAVEALRQD